jgi:hypothetical protein
MTVCSNFAGRGYVAGPVGNNHAKTDPQAAMLSLDWFEFGRARGSTLMWTEDWFGDSEASQWGYYGARLRSASRLAPSKDVIHGGYIVPRAGGQLSDGLLMKMMAIIGSGGKALKFYVFGPEYNFPGAAQKRLSNRSRLQMFSTDVVVACVWSSRRQLLF